MRRRGQAGGRAAGDRLPSSGGWSHAVGLRLAVETALPLMQLELRCIHQASRGYHRNGIKFVAGRKKRKPDALAARPAGCRWCATSYIDAPPSSRHYTRLACARVFHLNPTTRVHLHSIMLSNVRQSICVAISTRISNNNSSSERRSTFAKRRINGQRYHVADGGRAAA